MRNRAQFLVNIPLFVCLSLQVACESSVIETIASGSDKDEYVEEGLSEKAERYERELILSNAAIEYISKGQYEEFYSLGDVNFQRSTDLERVRSLLQQIENDLGRITEYKKNQWAFTVRIQEGLSCVYSTKNVLQGGKQVYYHFQFALNGESLGISAFWVDPKRSGDRASIAIERVMQLNSGFDS